MSRVELDKILKSYQVYYDIESEEVEEPFSAEAVFHSHDKRYFLIKKAIISEAETHEYVYIAEVNELNKGNLDNLVKTAWERGLKQVEPSVNHRSSDIVLIILAEKITPETIKMIKNYKLTKSYKFTFHGWSDFLLIVKNQNTGEIYFNRRAANLKKMYTKILNN